MPTYLTEDEFKPVKELQPPSTGNMPQREAAPMPGYSHPRSFSAVRPPLDPALDPKSNLTAAMIAAGASTAKVGRGMQQLYHGAMGNEPQLQRLAAENADAKQVMAPLEGAYPWSTGIGSALPAMAIPVGGAGINSLSGLAKLAGQGAAIPAMSYGSAGERAGGALVGAAGNVAGGALGSLVGSALRPAAGRVTPENEAFARYMKDAYGVTTLPGSLMENNRLKRFESQLPNQLGSSNKASDIALANQKGFNRAAASSVGQTADNVGEGVRRAAQEQTSAGYETLASRAAKTAELGDPVKRVAMNAYKKLTVNENDLPAAKILDQLDELVQTSWGSGQAKSQEWIQSRVSTIGKWQRQALSEGEKELAAELGKVKNALNDARYAKSPVGDRATRAELDKQQATLYTIDNMRKNGVIDDMGNIKVGSVDTTLRKNAGRRTGAINDPLSDLAEYNARFPKMNDSGTAGNLLANDPLKGSVLNPMQWPGMAARSAYLSDAGQKYMKHGALAVLPKMARDPLEELMAQQFAGMPIGFQRAPILSGGLLGNAALGNLVNGR